MMMSSAYRRLGSGGGDVLGGDEDQQQQQQQQTTIDGGHDLPGKGKGANKNGNGSNIVSHPSHGSFDTDATTAITGGNSFDAAGSINERENYAGIGNNNHSDKELELEDDEEEDEEELPDILKRGGGKRNKKRFKRVTKMLRNPRSASTDTSKSRLLPSATGAVASKSKGSGRVLPPLLPSGSSSSIKKASIVVAAATDQRDDSGTRVDVDDQTRTTVDERSGADTDTARENITMEEEDTRSAADDVTMTSNATSTTATNDIVAGNCKISIDINISNLSSSDDGSASAGKKSTIAEAAIAAKVGEQLRQQLAQQTTQKHAQPLAADLTKNQEEKEETKDAAGITTAISNLSEDSTTTEAEPEPTTIVVGQKKQPMKAAPVKDKKTGCVESRDATSTKSTATAPLIEARDVEQCPSDEVVETRDCAAPWLPTDASSTAMVSVEEANIDSIDIPNVTVPVDKTSSSFTHGFNNGQLIQNQNYTDKTSSAFVATSPPTASSWCANIQVVDDTSIPYTEVVKVGSVDSTPFDESVALTEDGFVPFEPFASKPWEQESSPVATAVEDMPAVDKKVEPSAHDKSNASIPKPKRIASRGNSASSLLGSIFSSKDKPTRTVQQKPTEPVAQDINPVVVQDMKSPVVDVKDIKRMEQLNSTKPVVLQDMKSPMVVKHTKQSVKSTSTGSVVEKDVTPVVSRDMKSPSKPAGRTGGRPTPESRTSFAHTKPSKPMMTPPKPAKKSGSNMKPTPERTTSSKPTPERSTPARPTPERTAAAAPRPAPEMNASARPTPENSPSIRSRLASPPLTKVHKKVGRGNTESKTGNVDTAIKSAQWNAALSSKYARDYDLNKSTKDVVEQSKNTIDVSIYKKKGGGGIGKPQHHISIHQNCINMVMSDVTCDDMSVNSNMTTSTNRLIMAKASRKSSKVVVKKRAATKIQCAIRQHLAVAEVQKRRDAPIVCIQAMIRGAVIRKAFEFLTSNATLIQSTWRMYSAQSKFQRTVNQIVVIQCVMRQRLARKALHQCRLGRESAIMIQNICRTFVCMNKYRRAREDIITVQSLVRHRAASKRFSTCRDAAVFIQQCGRGTVARRRFTETAISIIIIQALARGVAARRRFAEATMSITKIQALARGEAARRRFVEAIMSIAKIQALARGDAARSEYYSSIGAAIMVQASVRRWMTRTRYSHEIKNIVKVQASVRRNTAQRRYEATRRMAIAAQSLTRRASARRHFGAIKAAVRTQAVVRMLLRRQSYHRQRSSAIIVQSNIRRSNVMRRYNASLKAVAQRKEMAAVVIQMIWRGHKARVDYAVLKEKAKGAALLESCWSRFAVGEQFMEPYYDPCFDDSPPPASHSKLKKDVQRIAPCTKRSADVPSKSHNKLQNPVAESNQKKRRVRKDEFGDTLGVCNEEDVECILLDKTYSQDINEITAVGSKVEDIAAGKTSKVYESLSDVINDETRDEYHHEPDLPESASGEAYEVIFDEDRNKCLIAAPTLKARMASVQKQYKRDETAEQTALPATRTPSNVTKHQGDDKIYITSSGKKLVKVKRREKKKKEPAAAAAGTSFSLTDLMTNFSGDIQHAVNTIKSDCVAMSFMEVTNGIFCDNESDSK